MKRRTLPPLRVSQIKHLLAFCTGVSSTHLALPPRLLTLTTYIFPSTPRFRVLAAHLDGSFLGSLRALGLSSAVHGNAARMFIIEGRGFAWSSALLNGCLPL
jgi:hypothetical protein